MTDTHGSKWEPEIAVDLDGTLAEYDGWKGVQYIGKPISAMANRVKQWHAQGKTVVIFTARVSGDDAEVSRECIEAWLIGNGLPELEITAVKRKQFIEFWDDRAIQVERNTGRVIYSPTLIADDDGDYSELIGNLEKDKPGSVLRVKDFSAIRRNEKALSPQEDFAKRKNTSKVENSGLSCSYYVKEIQYPWDDSKSAYVAECGEICESLGMDPFEANIFKELWRKAAQRQGKTKKGNTSVRSAEKIKFFADRIYKSEKR
jgi:hypothetical protein